MRREVRSCFLISLGIVILFFFQTGYVYGEEYRDLDPWQSAYLKILCEERDNRDPQAPDDEQIMAYMLYDVDKDNIPELILRFGKTTASSVCRIYTMSDDTAVRIAQFFLWRFFSLFLPRQKWCSLYMQQNEPQQGRSSELRCG